MLKDEDDKSSEISTRMLNKALKKVNNLTPLRVLLIMFSMGIVDVEFVVNKFEKELKKLNSKKVGGPFIYPNSFIHFAGILKIQKQASYVELANELRKLFPAFHTPNHSTLHRRMNKINVDILNDLILVLNEKLSIGQDSTGFEYHAGSGWIEYKWKLKRRLFIKLHIIVEVKTQVILACSVTTKRGADSTQFEPLIKEVLDLVNSLKELNKSIEIEYLADKAYDSKKIFDFCKEHGITPIIPVRKKAKSHGNDKRSKEVRIQFGGSINCKNVNRLSQDTCLSNQDKWRIKSGYTKRSLTETPFSTTKRKHGEKVKAKKWKNVQQEMLFRVAAHNLKIIETRVREILKSF